MIILREKMDRNNATDFTMSLHRWETMTENRTLILYLPTRLQHNPVKRHMVIPVHP
jgi:hypothetical protein